MDIIFVKTDKLFAPLLRRKGFFILPEWIRMSLDISRPLNYIYDGFKKSAKEDIRKIKKYGYTYEFSTNLEKFEFFYHKIYLPYILRRHGKRTIESAVNYYEIRNLFERGKLMLVKMGERYVSGLIFRTEGDTAIALYTGVLSNPDYLSKAAGSALYYFFIEWAKKQGFIKIKFGGARPFLNDGTFQYKKKWGMKISISRMMPGIFGLKICNYESKATQSFLLHNPFLCIDKNRLKAMIFSHRKISDEESQKLRKKYYAPGMSDFEIVHLDKLS
ncbi:MAG: GNAT family N-acetyltransferase [Methanomicrobia archaeon]|nr:GNAT family N-acetyltransferase [Methanomicrobia archaeon]